MLPVTKLTAPDVEQSIDKRIAREAALWSVRLHPSAKPSAQTLAVCENWRSKNVIHEIAWQRAQEFNAKFGVLSPSIGNATLNRPSLPERRRAIKALVVAITAAPVGWYAYKNGVIDAFTADHRTAVGERKNVQLADGSQIELNTDSAVDVIFSNKQRLLILRRGEAFVKTAKDPSGASRPFLVKTEHGLLRALGTVFSVRTASDVSTVSVFEHAVEVTIPAAPAIIVNQGEQISFSHNEIQRPTPLPPHADAWKDGLLYAFKTPLSVFTNELSRYRRGWIRCHPSVAAMQVSGSFQLDDTDHVLQALVATLPIKVTFYARYWVTIGPIEG
jgi:transmembrane sensor